jgi:hypothetical protein
MRTITKFLLLFFLLLGPTFAQSPHPNPSSTRDAIQRNYWESLLNAALQSRTATQTELAEHMEARCSERQFLLKADKFIQAWTSLAHEYNQKGGFNMKKAKQVSKAFHDLEKSEGWPKADRR